VAPTAAQGAAGSLVTPSAAVPRVNITPLPAPIAARGASD